MITRKTLLILGAGASFPFGFPLGKQLADFLQHIVEDGAFLSALLRFGKTDNEIRLFSKAFQDSAIPSIDEFLNHQPIWADVGKLAIAYSIVRCETPQGVVRDPAKQNHGVHWYGHLWDSMRGTWDDFNKNRISVITFNYDRSLEYFLAKSLATTHGKSLAEGIQKVNELKIVHVHGMVGKLSDSPPSDGSREYLNDTSPDSLYTAANGIQLIHEREKSADFLVQIRELVEAAERICFLGFSYQPENVKLLSPDVMISRMNDQLATLEMYGTAIGLEKAQIQHSVNQFAPVLIGRKSGLEILERFPTTGSCQSLLLSKGVLFG